jgi:hypothetical protein
LKVKWNRSDDGFTDSKCGRFSITPLWCGRVKPQWYELKDAKDDPKKKGGWHDTQGEAKKAAQYKVDKENGDLPEEEEWPPITDDML